MTEESISARGHQHTCGCLPMSRRSLLLAGSASVLTSAFAARVARAADDGNFEAMLVNCIDPRFTAYNFAYMASNGMKDLYSHFVIAGGPIGIVSPRFKDWHKAFWDNLDVSLQLHRIKRVVALTHRDCGAAKLAFGDEKVASREAETISHGDALRTFRSEIVQRHPKLAVDLGVMALDGRVEKVA